MPRLRAASPCLDGAVRLHFHSRGAMSNLFIESQPAVPLVHESEVGMRAVVSP